MPKTEGLQKITKERRAELLQAFMKAAAESGEKGMHFNKILRRVEETFTLTDHERSKNPKGHVRWKVFLHFWSYRPAKAGWMRRHKNVFWITEEGSRQLDKKPIEMTKLLNEILQRAEENGQGEEGEAETSEEKKTGPVEIVSYKNREKTVFKKVDYTLDSLLTYIGVGDIGLPDIQRPFVWSTAKVRDLFDSMYRGFPIGYLLFWDNPNAENTRHIGMKEGERKIPRLLIVDGQQRLTSLYAVFTGFPVLDNDYKERLLEIAFRPTDGRFEVADAAIKRDPEFIANISDLWKSGKSSRTIINSYIETLQKKRPLTEAEEEEVSHNIDRLFDLQKYPFTVLEISSTVDEEQVADIFVRINSEGVKLNQGDFILTLMSVFWDEGRKELEHFCYESRQATSGGKPSPFNYFISPAPDQLLRVETAIGFHRGRLKNVYQLLRGKDMETGLFSTEQRDAQFSILKDAQVKALDLRHWHGFFAALMGAGFRSQDLITSEICLIYNYVYYLIGRTRFGIAEDVMQSLVGRYYFATAITNQYVGSFESAIESELTRIKDIDKADEFIQLMENAIKTLLTSDFWSINLPSYLESSSARNPAYNAYLAAQNKLGTPVLFSKNKTIADMLDPSVRSVRKALEKHHLFPRAYLESEDIEDLKLINQVANFALIDWSMNSDISDAPPDEYVPAIRKQFEPKVWAKMCEAHALPEGWEKMEYLDFLDKRRKLMAQIIRKGFEAIKE